MKKIIALCLSVLCLCGLVACGNSPKKDKYQKSEVGESAFALYENAEKVQLEYGIGKDKLANPIAAVKTGDNTYVYVERTENYNGDEYYYDYSIGFIFVSNDGQNIAGDKLDQLHLFCEYKFNYKEAIANGNIYTGRLSNYYSEKNSDDYSYSSGDVFGFTWTVENHDPQTFTLKNKSYGEKISNELKEASANAIGNAKTYFANNQIVNIW